MSINVPTHPLDLTGTKTSNKISGEVHPLSSGSYRTAIPNFGAYFTNSLVVRDTSDGSVLVAYDDYVAILYYEQPSIRSGLEVCAGLLVKDTNIAEIELEYQAVGGEFESVTPILIDLIDQFDIGDPQSVSWGSLVGVPDAFPPTPHLHKVSDLYGFEDIVYILGEMRNVILNGDVAKFDLLKSQLDAHKVSSDHDGRYYTQSQLYTQSEVDALIADVKSAHIPTNTRVGSDGMQINDGDRIIVDSSAGPFSMIAPANPSTSAVFSVYDFGGSLEDNPVTIDRNGENIMNLAENTDLNINNGQFHFEYRGTTKGWRIT